MSKSENDKALAVEPGMYVEYAYRLYNEEDGGLLFEATREHPDMMVCGASTEVVPGLVQAMEGGRPFRDHPSSRGGFRSAPQG